MSRSQRPRPPHGGIGYIQLPATDIAASLAFYREVFGWEGESEYSSFTAPGMIGQWSLDLSASEGGPVLWMHVDKLYPALTAVVANGGRVRAQPQLDQGARWLAEVDDPAGNRIGLFALAQTGQPQTLLAVSDVEASSHWYQQLLGLTSDHGGPEYERLLSDGVLVMQLHHNDVGHHHGTITADPESPMGNGILVWFGEVADFDGVVTRAAELDAPVVREPHRNPPEGNGPAHRELWIRDPDGYTVVIASPDGEDWRP